MGGLGNQLFQYALGRRIAYFENVPLKLDLTWFDSYALRKYSLQYFNITDEVASCDEISLLKGSSHKKLILSVSQILEKFLPYYKRSFIRERSYSFDPNLFRTSKDVYLDGYWQSEKYFEDIGDIIHKEFTLKHKPEKANVDMARHIQNTESVSLHIRRGDYVSNTKTNQVHGSCSLDYYYRAIEKMTDVIDRPNFFVFSDDPLWVKENLKVSHPVTFVVHNGFDKDYEDLRLMSLCQHHIIANSTFSWWGAWLCENKKKMVFAPDKWFNSSEFDTKDLIPASWQRI